MYAGKKRHQDDDVAKALECSNGTCATAPQQVGSSLNAFMYDDLPDLSLIHI